MRTLVAGACLVGVCVVAYAQDDSQADPFDALRPAMNEQDKLFAQKKGEQVVAAARGKAKDQTPESLFLLGRALVLHAIAHAEEKLKPPAPGEPPPELVFDADGVRLLDEANECFERSKEAGGLLYAPAHYGAARVAHAKREFDRGIEELRQALRISRNFKDAALLLAQSLWAKGADSDAEFALYKFLESRPKDVGAHLLLGKYKLSKKLYAQAEPEFRAAVGVEPGNVEARRLLAFVLMSQEKFDESAQHWDMVRRAVPKDDEAYVVLFRLHVRRKRLKDAEALLNDCVREAPAGPYGAKWANAMLEQMKIDPKQFDPPEKATVEDLRKRLDSPDPAEVVKALDEMRALRLPALPHRVYQMLYDGKSTAPQRLACVRLIGDLGDPQTLGVLEVMLAHPTERDADQGVRKEVAHAISLLPTDGVVPILYEALGDSDADIREWAVQGIAARTGKWFRMDLKVRTPDKDWPAEMDLYRRWWTSTSSSAAKRTAILQLAEVYAPVEKGTKTRVARYALPAMEDPIETTWRAGYDLFRQLTARSFGSEQGPVAAPERARIAVEARAWIVESMRGGK